MIAAAVGEYSRSRPGFNAFQAYLDARRGDRLIGRGGVGMIRKSRVSESHLAHPSRGWKMVIRPM
jgi:hypothetical protein